jgi:hypothetical protein
MKKFQFTEKINSNTKLKFPHKALINQILSFQENEQIFHATNKYLSTVWGVEEKTIKRIIADLKAFNLLDVELDRKKHSNGAGEWYNKRYIKVNTENLKLFLDNKETTSTENKAPKSIKKEKPIPTIIEVKEELIQTKNDVKDEMVRLQDPIILLEKNKGKVKTIETISDTLPEEIQVIFKFDDGEEMNSIAYYVDGVYFLKYEYLSEQNSRIDAKSYQL